MNRVFFTLLIATLLCGPLAKVAGAVTLRASRANVSGAGETATICVDLETEGEQVAGTQNEIVWDPSCATLTGVGSCEAASGHGKELHASFPNGDGLPPLRAFVFSMRNVDPMPDGQLYCCDFTSELVSSGTCSISIQQPRASDPSGKALSASAADGMIAMGGGGGGGVVSGGMTGGGATGGGGGATGGGVTGGGVAGGGGATGGGAAGGSGSVAGGAAGGVASGLGAAPAEVVPGGVAEEQPLDTEALARAARDAARAEADRIMAEQLPDEEEEVVVEEEVEIVEPEPTEEPTVAAVEPTAPAPKPTEAPAKPTAKPTVARTPAAAAAAAEAPKEESRGWFGCQVTTGGGGGLSIFLLIGLAGIVANRLRRR